jgi:hypothetical protein
MKNISTAAANYLKQNALAAAASRAKQTFLNDWGWRFLRVQVDDGNVNFPLFSVIAAVRRQ